MGSYSFPLLDDGLDEDEQQWAEHRRIAVHECIQTMKEGAKRAQEEERRKQNSRNRVITFRMPVDLLARLDAVTDDAATSRGHMLRQIVAEYMCYVEECDIRYKGSLLTAHAAKRHK